MKVACRAVLMLSLMAMVLVDRRELSLLMMSLRSQRVRPFLVEGALGVAGGRAAAGAGFADGGEAFFFVFLTTCAHVWTGGGGGGGEGGRGGGGEGVGSGVDPEAPGEGVFFLPRL